MTLPAAVKAQAERANALSDKIKAGQPITIQDIGGPINAPTNPTPSAPPAAEVAPAPAPASAPAPPPPSPPPPAPPSSENVDWQHKFNVLQGKYNAEVPRLHEQNRELSTRIQNMQSQLTATQGMLASLGTAGAPPVLQGNSAQGSLVKPEEIREFGADLHDFIQRAARDAVLPAVEQTVQRQVGPVAQQVQQLGAGFQNVAQAQALSAEDRFYTALEQAAPGYEQVNNTNAFADWLAVRDPYSGATRGDMLSHAFQNLDAPRVAAFFNGFRNEHAVVTPNDPATPTGQSPTPAVSLVSMAAPGIGIGGPPASAPNEAGKRFYTQADVQLFYEQRRRGVYKGREAEADALERDMFRAQRDGRIRAR